MQRFNGHNLRAARKTANLKKEHLAIIVGRSSEAINLYECGHRRPPTAILERLAAACGVSVAAFFDETDKVPA
ncbi:MAG: helix-turn-helix domain-containing protein [Actinomycetota bacterium]|nr:helix-turn-helix domain-containing protein [Actinomycetota bacterium]